MSASPLTTRIMEADRRRSALAMIRVASRAKVAVASGGVGSGGSGGSGGVAGKSARWRTVFVDGEVLGAVTPSTQCPDEKAPVEHTLRLVARQDQALEGVRKNVRDAAGAVLAWLSAVVAHEGKRDLDDILDRCLRPGPDVRRMNYQALAEDVFRVTGVELSAKRVQTAVAHLRLARSQRDQASRKPRRPAVDLEVKLGELHARLTANFESLLHTGRDEDSLHQRRAIATEVLAAVRCAASRVIDHGFGEGIPEAVDLQSLEGRFLRFVHAQQKAAGDVHGDRSLAADLHRLLVTLGRHDGTAEGDMKLVMHGSLVVQSLLGPDSLAGLLAQLNVLVAGRSLLDTELYVRQMHRLAAKADALHDDASAKSYLNWMRRLPEDQRLPSPLRLASYARSNAATRLLDRLFDGQIEATTLITLEDGGAHEALPLACAIHDAMLQRDGGFTLTLTGEFIRHVVTAKLRKNRKPLDAWLAALGPARTLDRLEALIRFENNPALVAEANAHALRMHPSLRHQLIQVAGH